MIYLNYFQGVFDEFESSTKNYKRTVTSVNVRQANFKNDLIVAYQAILEIEFEVKLLEEKITVLVDESNSIIIPKSKVDELVATSNDVHEYRRKLYDKYKIAIEMQGKENQLNLNDELQSSLRASDTNFEFARNAIIKIITNSDDLYEGNYYPLSDEEYLNFILEKNSFTF